MEIYSKFRFQMEDPYEITQFLRGELYILIDYILSKAHHPCDSSLIVSFMEIYMKFFNEYIDFFKENLKEVRVDYYYFFFFYFFYKLFKFFLRLLN